jgi:TPR repeat protein
MNAARSNCAKNSSLLRTTTTTTTRARLQWNPYSIASTSSLFGSTLTPTTTTVAATASGINASNSQRCMSSAIQAARSYASPVSAAQSSTISGMLKRGFPATTTRMTALPPSSSHLHPVNSRGIASLLHRTNIFGENTNRSNSRDPMTVALQVEAAYQKGKKYHYGLGVEQNLDLAFESYQQAAYEGHVDSYCALASMYLKGEINGWVDYDKARQLFSIAASVGHASAQFQLGEMYESGLGVGVDLLKAQHWYIEAAKRNYAPALCNLGTMYAEADGVEYDPVRAVQLLQAAADQGLADAQCCLGLMYVNGEGVEADAAKAEEYYMRAAEQGHALAQVNLGHLYYTQNNAEMAKECWELAAQQGVALALCNLGAMYMSGQGVPQSYSKAFEYYSAAAHKGDFEAQYQMGVLYEHGHGVQQQPTTALSWFNKAAQQGHTEAKECVLRLSMRPLSTSSTPTSSVAAPPTPEQLGTVIDNSAQPGKGRM